MHAQKKFKLGPRKFISAVFYKEHQASLKKIIVKNLEPLSVDRWEKWDHRVGLLKKIFDEMFGSQQSVKVICVNLNLPRMNSDMNILTNVQQLMKKFYRQLAMLSYYLGAFYKLEVQVDGEMKILCNVVFENLRHKQIDELYKEIKQIWISINQYDSMIKVENASVLLNKRLYYEKTMQAGVISKKSKSYDDFVQVNLGYIANIQHYFLILLAGNKLIIENSYDLVGKNGDTNVEKIEIKPRKHRTLDHRREKSLVLNKLEINGVLKPIKKKISDFELSYSHILFQNNNVFANISKIYLILLRIEVTVLLAIIWKQEAVSVTSQEIIENDLASLISTYQTEFRNVQLIEKYVDFLGPRLLCFLIAFKCVESFKDYGGFFYDKFLYKNRLFTAIRNLMNLPLDSFMNLIKCMAQRNIIDHRIFTKFNVLLTRRSTNKETLNEWLYLQERVRKNSFSSVEKYLHKLEDKGSSWDVLFVRKINDSQDFLEFDDSVRRIVDKFKQEYPEMLGYIGYCFPELSDSLDLMAYKARITFYFDKHYVGPDEPAVWIKKLNNLAKKQKFTKRKLSLCSSNIVIEQIHQEKIFDIKSIIEGIQLDQNGTNKRIHRYTSDHLFALVHRDLFWMHTKIFSKQILIRGRTKYKKRRKKLSNKMT